MIQQQPTVTNDHGEDIHPAFGVITVNRHSHTPGAVLFDSDVRHVRTVVVTIETAARKRDLARDWIRPDKRITQIEMSEAQWASLVSSVGGQPVPCTLRQTQENHTIPQLALDPRLALSANEVKNAGREVFDEITAAVAAFDALDPKATAKEKRAAMDAIRNATRNIESNLDFVTGALTKHAEDVVQRSRADIEAMVMRASEQAGLPAAAKLLELGD